MTWLPAALPLTKRDAETTERSASMGIIPLLHRALH